MAGCVASFDHILKDNGDKSVLMSQRSRHTLIRAFSLAIILADVNEWAMESRRSSLRHAVALPTCRLISLAESIFKSVDFRTPVVN